MTPTQAQDALALLGIDPKSWWTSTTLRGLLVIVAAKVLAWSGIEIEDAHITALVTDGMTLLGLIVAWVGRVRAVAPIDKRAVAPGLNLPKQDP